MKVLAVSFDPGDDGRQRIDRVVSGSGNVIYLTDVDVSARAAALTHANVLLTRNTATELHANEFARTANLSLIQFMSAGVDFVRLDQLPGHVAIAGNGGAYAEPMAEHALAMLLAAAKRLFLEHRNLARGEFNQFTPTRMLRDMTVGILGFGGIGIATARVVKALGVRVHAINRRGQSDEHVDWMGSVNDLDTLLQASDALVLSLPLTARTEGLIDAAALGRMKPDAILVNLARGEIVDEAALHAHLVAQPEFTACIDAWWVEPIRHGEFRMDQPFMDLPNVIASPHNSASVKGWSGIALERAASNCKRALDGKPPQHLIGDDERAARRAQTKEQP